MSVSHLYLPLYVFFLISKAYNQPSVWVDLCYFLIIYFFINKYFMNINYMPPPVLSTENTTVNQTTKVIQHHCRSSPVLRKKKAEWHVRVGDGSDRVVT